jgi:UDP-N-acetylmuramate dehydrogenase
MNMADVLQFHGLRGELRRDEPMARHVSWRAGGRAERFFAPADLPDLQHFLRSLPRKEPVLFVGLGSNLLVRDGGFRGTAIAMHSARKHAALRDGLLFAEAGLAAPKVARFAARHDLAGAEFLAGIPGTVGGALAMNAGCYGSETWDIVEQVQTIDRHGALHLRRPGEYEIGYRHCQPRTEREEWFVAAWFRLIAGVGEASRARIKEFLAKRIATQPLQLPNAGSVFRNPPGDHAARLIESCGLKGLERGGARVSEKHANFIVNPDGAASAADIESLILEVQRRVEDRKGIRLVPEVRIVGEAA